MDSITSFPLSEDPEEQGIYGRVRSAASHVFSSLLDENQKYHHPRKRSDSRTSLWDPMDASDESDVQSVFSVATKSLAQPFLASQYPANRRRSLTSLSRNFWMRDENASTCFRCTLPFSTFRRKHHCRVCGQIFCSSCTNLVGPELIHNAKKANVRVCYNCLSSLQDQLSSSDEEEVQNDTVTTPVAPRTHIHQRIYDDLKQPDPKQPVYARMRSATVSSNVESVHEGQPQTIEPSVVSVGLNTASSKLLSLFLDRLLGDADLEPAEWHTCLLNVLQAFTNTTPFNGLRKDRVHPRDWVKIKRIPGGAPSDVHVFHGTAFTHNLATRTMPTALENPRILFLTFPIEYTRGSHQYMSLKPVLAQESEYLENVVARISELHPTIIVSSCNISSRALDLFEEANLAVATHCRQEALVRLARYTDADILTSIDRLSTNPRLGACARFEVKTFIFDDDAKSYLFFTLEQSKEGCTILVRGNPNAAKRAKLVLEIMVGIAFSLRLETSLLRDQFILVPTKFEISQVLSSSPMVDFGKPHLLVLYNTLEDSIVHLSNELDTITKLQDAAKSASPEIQSKVADLAAKFDVSLDLKLDLADKLVITVQMCRSIQQGLVDRTYAYWNLVKSQWDSLEQSSPYMFNPSSHQSLVVLFTLLSHESNNRCSGPGLLLIEYYSESDFTIGQFLENMCKTYHELCPEGCKSFLGDHTRIYSQGDQEVTFSVEKHNYEVSGFENSILMWSHCCVCNQSSPKVPMSATTWNYSFGKYLELCFWSRPLTLRADTCSHDVFKDHTAYFSFQGLAVRVERKSIDLYRIKLPPLSVFWCTQDTLQLKIDTYKLLNQNIKRLWDSILENINTIKMEGLPNEKIADLQSRLITYRQDIETDRSSCMKLLDEHYVSLAPTDYLGLNEVLRYVQELLSLWHTKFSEIDALFFPSESDIRQVTVQQLKGLFTDELKSDQKDSDGEKPSAASPTREPQTPENQKTQIEQDSFSPTPPGDETNESVSPGMVRVKSQLGTPIDLPVSPLQARLQTPIRRGEKVSYLAQHFEELSLEFEKERQKEQLRLRERRGALALTSSRQVAEVFRDVSSAVNEEQARTEPPNTSDAPSKPPADDSRSISEDTRKSRSQSLSAEEQSDAAPAVERKSLIKTLIDFWAERSSTRFGNIKYLLGPEEHLFSDSLVVVREAEPSSLISFCLSLKDYQDRVQGIKIGTTKEDIMCREQSLLKETGVHLRYHFTKGHTDLSCKIFFSEQFEALRRHCDCGENYIQSLSRCLTWDALGGKSGSAFLKTRDNRFILKELSASEVDSFVNFAPSYFEYTSQTLFHDLPSALSKTFGFYQVNIQNSLTSLNVKMYLIVTENLFFEGSCTRLFDLKGSMRNRKVNDNGDTNQVLMDENMVEYIDEKPLFCRENDKKMLRTSLYNDTLFLTKMNVMDYSLVIGIDVDKKTVVAGIIDYIRTFTWDKKIESWVKGRTNAGGIKDPTVISPKQYKARFRESMEQYFFMVPDCWYQYMVEPSDEMVPVY